MGDIGFEGYKAHLDRQERLTAGDKESCSASTEIGLRVARRTGEIYHHTFHPAWKPGNILTDAFFCTTRRAMTVFQGLASIVLPAVTIHSAVKYSAPLFLKSQNPRIKGWGPTV